MATPTARDMLFTFACGAAGYLAIDAYQDIKSDLSFIAKVQAEKAEVLRQNSLVASNVRDNMISHEYTNSTFLAVRDPDGNRLKILAELVDHDFEH